MPRVIVAEGCRQVDSPSGIRYSARGRGRGGVFTMTADDARLAVKVGGAIVSEAGTTRRGIGFRCLVCGFGSFLRRCGQCGGECEREG